ncbi:MAG: hypothetical protein ACK5HY_01320 [Parahaliea sp.]
MASRKKAKQPAKRTLTIPFTGESLAGLDRYVERGGHTTAAGAVRQALVDIVPLLDQIEQQKAINEAQNRQLEKLLVTIGEARSAAKLLLQISDGYRERDQDNEMASDL